MTPSELVLSLYPTVKGCGYVFFEDALSPFDWGVVHAIGSARNRRTLSTIEKLIARYQPLVVVLEDWQTEERPRTDRILQLYDGISKIANRKMIPVKTISKRAVREHFAHRNALTKYDIALHIAKIIPAFSYQIPPVRKAWNAVSRSQALYDAAAIGLTFLA